MNKQDLNTALEAFKSTIKDTNDTYLSLKKFKHLRNENKGFIGLLSLIIFNLNEFYNKHQTNLTQEQISFIYESVSNLEIIKFNSLKWYKV